MFLLDAINELTSSPTMGSKISLGIFGFVALLALIGFLFGFKAGFFKATLRFFTVIASAVISFFVATGLTGTILKFFEGKTLEEMITMVVPSYTTDVSPEIQNIVNCFDAETAQRLIIFFVYILIIPLVFAVIFFLLKLVSIILVWIFSGLLGFSGKKKGLIVRFGGSAIGLVQGALISFVFLIPMAGFLGIAKDVREPLTDPETTEPETAAYLEEFYTWWIDDVTDNAAITAVNKFGGHSIFEKLTTAKISEEEDFKSEEQAKHFLKIYVDTMSLKDFKFTEADPELRDALFTLVADIGDDAFTADVVSGILRGISKATDTGAIDLPFEDPYKSIVLEAVSIFKDSDRNNLKGDLVTVANVFFILGENDIFSAMLEGDTEKTLNSLILEKDGTRVIDLVLDELDKNVRTSALIEVLTKLSVSIMGDSLGLDEDAQQVYENVKDGINSILAIKKGDKTDEEYKAEVSTQLDTTLKENNIVLEKEIVDTMAGFVAENFEGKEEITDRDVTDTILSYYDAYAEYQKNGTVPDDIPIPGGGSITIPDGTIPEGSIPEGSIPEGFPKP